MLACLERLFALEEGFAVVACCGKGAVVLDTLREQQPDILLVDVPPAADASVSLVREMKSAALPTRVVFLAEALSGGEVAAAVRLGVAGIVPKEVAPDALAQCIRRVHAGGVWLRMRPGPRGRNGRRAPDQASELTPREKEIVALIGEGLANKQIAKRLRLGEATVKTHLHHIYEKLRLRDRLQLSIYTGRKGPRRSATNSGFNVAR